MTVSVLATFKGKDDTYEKLKQSFKDALNETKNYEGCQYVVFTSTGGQFIGFKDKGDATVAYKLDKCN